MGITYTQSWKCATPPAHTKTGPPHIGYLSGIGRGQKNAPSPHRAIRQYLPPHTVRKRVCAFTRSSAKKFLPNTLSAFRRFPALLYIKESFPGKKQFNSSTNSTSPDFFLPKTTWHLRGTKRSLL